MDSGLAPGSDAEHSGTLAPRRDIDIAALLLLLSSCQRVMLQRFDDDLTMSVDKRARNFLPHGVQQSCSQVCVRRAGMPLPLAVAVSLPVAASLAKCLVRDTSTLPQSVNS